MWPLGGVERPVLQFDHVGLGIQPDAAVVDVHDLPGLAAVVADAHGAGAGVRQLLVEPQNQSAAGQLADRRTAVVGGRDLPRRRPSLAKVVGGDDPSAQPDPGLSPARWLCAARRSCTPVGRSSVVRWTDRDRRRGCRRAFRRGSTCGLRRWTCSSRSARPWATVRSAAPRARSPRRRRTSAGRRSGGTRRERPRSRRPRRPRNIGEQRRRHGELPSAGAACRRQRCL